MDNKTWTEFIYDETLSAEEEEEATVGDKILFALVLTAIIIAGLADALTVYILRRFKLRQKDHQNVYIFHISVLNLINLPFAVRFLKDLMYTKTEYDLLLNWWEPLLIDIICSFVFAQFSLMAIMTIDWYLVTFAPQTSAKFRKYTKSIIILAYAFVSVVPIYSLVMPYIWYNFSSMFSVYIVICNLLLCFILYLVFGVIYLCRGKSLVTANNATVLKISLIRVLLLLLVIIIVWLPSEETELFVEKNEFLDNVMVFFLLLVITSPVLQLILFYFWDANYKAALSRTFCCSKTNQMESGENVEEAMTYGERSNAEVRQQVN